MKDLKGSRALHFFTSFTPSSKTLTGDRQAPYTSKETLFSHEGLKGLKGDRVGNMNPLTCTIVEVP
jgi:hypothetical protein